MKKLIDKILPFLFILAVGSILVVVFEYVGKSSTSSETQQERDCQDFGEGKGCW